MKKVLIGLAIIVGAILVLGIIAPKEFEVKREITINKPKQEVFSYLKLLQNQSQWSPWEKKDPNMTKTSRGTDGTVGFVSGWSGNKEVGQGEQEITAIIEGERIDTQLRFEKPMKDICTAYITTETTSKTETKVVWGMKGEYKFPGNIICMLMNMNKKLGTDFETGLNSLKTVLEKQ